MSTTSPLPASPAGGAVAAASAGAPDAAAAAPKAKGAASAKGAAANAKGAASAKAPKASAPARKTPSDVARTVLQDTFVSGLVRALGVGRSSATRRSSSAAGYATATTSMTGALAFLRDPRLSLEEKLMKLLGYLNAKWDKDIQDRLDRIASGEAAKATTSSSKTKKKGLLGSIASAFSGALGGAGGVLGALELPAVKTALKKLGGPVLAAAASALGFPAAAPILLKYGPTVVDAALGIASSAGAQAKTSQSTGASGAAMSDSDRQTVMMEIQNIRSKQQEMFNLVSNILKSNHDTRSAIINNMR